MSRSLLISSCQNANEEIPLPVLLPTKPKGTARYFLLSTGNYCFGTRLVVIILSFGVPLAVYVFHSSGYRCQNTMSRKITLSEIAPPLLHFIPGSRLWKTCPLHDQCVAFTTAVTMQFIWRSRMTQANCLFAPFLDQSWFWSFAMKVWWLLKSPTTSRFVRAIIEDIYLDHWNWNRWDTEVFTLWSIYLSNIPILPILSGTFARKS